MLNNTNILFRLGKSTGIVTTARIQDATPAAAYAKAPSRAWYSDASLPGYARLKGCADISSQLVDNKGINVSNHSIFISIWYC